MPLSTTIKNTMVTAGSETVAKVQILSYNLGANLYTKIGSPESCSWGTASGGSIAISDDVEFTVPGSTTVHTVVLLTSEGTGLSESIAGGSISSINGYLGHAQFSSSYTFNNEGTFVLDNLVLTLT